MREPDDVVAWKSRMNSAIYDPKSSQNLLKVEVRLGRIRIVFE